MEDIPTTTILSLILSLFGFFTMVTGVALFYYRKDYRRLERLEAIQRAAESREIASFEAHWLERPVIWEVWADRYPKSTSKWEDFLVIFRFASSLSLVPFSFRVRLICNSATASQHDVRSRSTLDPLATASPESIAAGSEEQRVGIRRRGCRRPAETTARFGCHRLRHFRFSFHAHLPQTTFHRVW